MKYDFQKLKHARERKLMTRKQLAAAVGVSHTTVNMVESGKAPWIKAIRKIASFLEVSDVVKPNGGRRPA